MIVKNLLVNTLVVKNVTTGVQLVALIGAMSLTACANQKKIKNLKVAVETCRKDSKIVSEILRKKNKSCLKELKYCRNIRNKLLDKMEFYESRICD